MRCLKHSIGVNGQFVYVASLATEPRGVDGMQCEDLTHDLGTARSLLKEAGLDGASSHEAGTVFRLIWESEVVGIAIAKQSTDVTEYYFPMPDAAMYVFQCVVFERYRGRGFYSMLLLALMKCGYQNGYQQAIINCDDWNVPSNNGIRRAGFQLVGIGTKYCGARRFRSVGSPCGDRRLLDAACT